jgi:hypothetical protein
MKKDSLFKNNWVCLSMGCFWGLACLSSQGLPDIWFQLFFKRLIISIADMEFLGEGLGY